MTEMKKEANVTYPGHVNLKETSVFLNHRELISKLLLNILEALPESRVVSIDGIIKDVKDYLLQNKFDQQFDRIYEEHEVTEYKRMHIVQTDYLYTYIRTMIDKVKSLKDLNLSQAEFEKGIQVDDPMRSSYAITSAAHVIDDPYDFIDLDALARNTINEFIVDSQMTLGEMPKYPF